jgi:hypothetical protein
MAISFSPSIRSTASRWLIFTPAIYSDCGDVDRDCLMARVHRLFTIVVIISAYTLWRFFKDPTSGNLILFFVPIIVLVAVIEIDERIAEKTSLKIKSFKPTPIIRTSSKEIRVTTISFNTTPARNSTSCKDSMQSSFSSVTSGV